MLIERCLCGQPAAWGIAAVVNGLETRTCRCGVIHQAVDMDAEEYRRFYARDYAEVQRALKRPTYAERYPNDLRVARLRLAEYRPVSGPVLDVGAGNGAFVDALLAEGIEAWGTEYHSEHPRIYNGELCALDFLDGAFATVTFHDVLEHIPTPRETLATVKRILRPGGRLIVDFPDFWHPAGLHHWWPVQHLWLLSPDQLAGLLASEGFALDEFRHPIPGKLVAYSRSNGGGTFGA